MKIKSVERALLGVVLALALMLSASSCHKKLGPTAIRIEDSIRHYPATILGDDLEMVY